MQTPTHITFSDETQHNVGRYKAIAAVTVPFAEVERLQAELAVIIKTANLSEMKWEKVRNAKYRHGTMAALDWAFTCGSISVDVLAWDIDDSRHSVKRRDDIENLHRMHHHLLKNVMSRRGGGKSAFILKPDQNSAMRWKDVDTFLSHKSVEAVPLNNLGEGFKFGFRIKYNLHRIEPADSHDTPLVQLADIFAGMMAFSYRDFGVYQTWLAEQQGQGGLFSSPVQCNDASRGEEEKCRVLDSVHAKIRTAKLPIGLIHTKGLSTFAPMCSFNFWMWQSQRESDKAPIRPIVTKPNHRKSV